MNITLWKNKRERATEPFSPETSLSRLRNEMDRMFDRFFGDLRMPALFEGTSPWGVFPRMDLAETDTDIAVKAELPGVDPKDVNIEVVGNMLTIRGEKRQEKEEKRRDYHFVERQYGSFHRSITLPSSVDADKVDASYRNGVLTVTIPKRPEARPKKISVRSA